MTENIRARVRGGCRFDEFYELLWKRAKFNLLRSMPTDVPLNKMPSHERISR